MSMTDILRIFASPHSLLLKPERRTDSCFGVLRHFYATFTDLTSFLGQFRWTDTNNVTVPFMGSTKKRTTLPPTPNLHTLTRCSLIWTPTIDVHQAPIHCEWNLQLSAWCLPSRFKTQTSPSRATRWGWVQHKVSISYKFPLKCRSNDVIPVGNRSTATSSDSIVALNIFNHSTWENFNKLPGPGNEYTGNGRK